jgi:cyclopropane fatty-acyl-phospholipid synthase-like methyltransferase
VATREEDERRDTFDARYRADVLEANLPVEREAVGTDYGNTGFTTKAQAELLLEVLDLAPADLLLDLGSGAGWPGLYLADRSGCRVVVSDLTLSGMQHALRRTRADGLAGRTAAVVATARQLPFRPDSFDAMVHTDVLCCVNAKVSVLRASRRLLRRRGRLAFFTITVAEGLSAANQRRARLDGPPSAEGPPVSALLRRVGFTTVSEVDVTADYLATASAWVAARERHREAIRPLDPETYDDRMEQGRAAVAAIEDGLLRRSLHVAHAG